MTSLESEFEKAYGFKLHPNPTDGELEIQLEKVANQVIQIQVRDERGKVLYTNKFKSDSGNIFKEKLNLTELSAGSYFLEIQLKQGTITKKIIIQ